MATLSETPSDKNPIALQLIDLHKSFGTKEVHKGVSFDLHRGQIIALLGGSGTGKSVILRSIIGLEKPDQGQILFNGIDITKLSERGLTPVRVKIA
jgi:phospholipid/cholesterol/gamma-HCH transport system ATP-binding protein